MKWRDGERAELPPREDRRRDDRPPREDRPRREDRPHPIEHEDPTEETLAKIPDRGPFTAFVQLDPRVSNDVREDDIGYHFQDDENKTILVKAIRIKCHPSGSVRTIHVDFENQDSLRNALYLKKPFRDKAIRIDVAVSTPARDGPRRDGPRRDDRDRDRGGLRGTQYDIDAKEAEWMAQRVQEKVVIDDAPVAASPKVPYISVCAVCDDHTHVSERRSYTRHHIHTMSSKTSLDDVSPH